MVCENNTHTYIHKFAPTYTHIHTYILYINTVKYYKLYKYVYYTSIYEDVHDTTQSVRACACVRAFVRACVRACHSWYGMCMRVCAHTRRVCGICVVSTYVHGCVLGECVACANLFLETFPLFKNNCQLAAHGRFAFS
jgi:hypothetical protein